MNNKILEITKQLQEMAANNPGLTIHLDEEELTVRIKNEEPANPNHFVHGEVQHGQPNYGPITKVHGQDWTAGEIVTSPQYNPGEIQGPLVYSVTNDSRVCCGEPYIQGSKA